MKKIDRNEQKRISGLWADAATRLRDIDRKLASQCSLKSQAISKSKRFSRGEVSSINEGLERIAKELDRRFK